MRKYTNAPKDMADAIKNGIPVTEEEALGDGWKTLLSRTNPHSKSGNRTTAKSASRLLVSRKKVYEDPARKGKAGFVHRIQIGELRLEIPGTAGEAYAKDLVDMVKDYVERHPYKKQA